MEINTTKQLKSEKLLTSLVQETTIGLIKSFFYGSEDGSNMQAAIEVAQDFGLWDLSNELIGEYNRLSDVQKSDEKTEQVEACNSGS